MADNIPTKDRSGANLDIASKDVSGVQFPRNILTDAAGTDINPALKSQLPTALGSAADAASLAVTHSTEDKARIGSLTETAPGTDTASSGLNGRLQRIAQRLTSLIAQLPATLGIKTAANSLSIAPASDARFIIANSAGTALDTDRGTPQTTTLRVALASWGNEAYADITRPANTTPYSAGDVVGGRQSIQPLVDVTTGSSVIHSVTLRYDVASIPAGMRNFRLHLYNGAPPSNYADNAAWDLPSGDRGTYIGYIDLGAIADMGATLWAQINNTGKLFKSGFGYGGLYVYIQTLTAYTPAANSETLRLTINTVGV